MKKRNQKHRTLENESYLRYLDPTMQSLFLSDLTILDLHTLNIVIYRETSMFRHHLFPRNMTEL